MLHVKSPLEVLEQSIESALNFKPWLGRTRRAELERENADLHEQLAQQAAQIAELTRQTEEFRPLQEVVGDEATGLLQAALPVFAKQLQLASDALVADLNNDLDAPAFEHDSLNVARMLARTMIETALNLGEEKNTIES